MTDNLDNPAADDRDAATGEAAGPNPGPTPGNGPLGAYRRSDSGPIRRLLGTSLLLLALMVVLTSITHHSLLEQFDENVQALPDGPTTGELVWRFTAYLLTWGLVLLAVFGAILWWQARECRRRMEQLVDQVRRVAGEPDAQQYVLISSHDELGEIAYHVNLILDRNRALLRDLGNIIARASESGASLTSGHSHTLELARKQFDDSSSLLAGLDELARSIKRAANDLDEACKRSLTHTEMAKDGGEKVSGSRSGLDRVLAGIAGVREQLEQLTQRSGEIGEVVQIILGITAQTQLVSLNAAIEAARAGAAGEGFAVVADEISKLAENSARVAGQVTQLLEAIREEATVASGEMGQVHRLAEDNRNHTQRASDRLDEIIHDTRQALENLSEISSAVELQSVTSENIASTFDQVVELMEQGYQSATETARVQQVLEDQIEELDSRVRSSGVRSSGVRSSGVRSSGVHASGV